MIVWLIEPTSIDWVAVALLVEESPLSLAVRVQVPADRKETKAVPSALSVAEQAVPSPVVTLTLGMYEDPSEDENSAVYAVPASGVDGTLLVKVTVWFCLPIVTVCVAWVAAR